MILLDVNVLVYAHRAEMPHHPACRQLLEDLIDGGRTFGVPEVVFSGVVRVVTLPVWQPPSTIDEAIRFCDAVRSARRCLVIQPATGHWELFGELCRATGAKGKQVADAYLAAFALDRDDEWITADADFGRFPGLRWRRPWEAHTRTNPR